MREIIFDTETTGLDFRLDRVIEIGAIELVNRFPTGRVFHEYIHPDGRDIHPDALAVHGISLDKLIGKPVFAGIADRFMEFIDGASLVAHNAEIQRPVPAQILLHRMYADRLHLRTEPVFAGARQPVCFGDYCVHGTHAIWRTGARQVLHSGRG